MIVCPYKELGRYAAIIPGLQEAMDAIAAMEGWNVGTIPLSDGNRILVQEGTTRLAGNRSEAHRNFLDIQYIVEGEETMGWAPVETLTPDGGYNDVKDVAFYNGDVDFMRIGAGYCYVVFPEDAHMPGVHLDQPHNYKKMVLKLKV